MNDNIQTLTSVLEARGELDKKARVESETARSVEDGANEIRGDQDAKKIYEQKEEDNQEALEVAQTMKELKGKKEG